MENLKIAIQKSGRLSEKSLDLLKESGISDLSNDIKLVSTDSSKNKLLSIILTG